MKQVCAPDMPGIFTAECLPQTPYSSRSMSSICISLLSAVSIVTRYTHQGIRVLLRVHHGVPEDIGVHDVELHLHFALVELSFHVGIHGINGFLVVLSRTGDKLRIEGHAIRRKSNMIEV